MDLLRRTVLKGMGASGVLAGLLAAGMLKPTLAVAADWNKAAFNARELDAALKAIGAQGSADNPGVVIRAQDMAENGATVPVGITSNIPNTTSISVLVVKNPFPLAAHFDFTPQAVAEVDVRLKFSETSVVQAIAKADGKFYSARKEIKVTVGGCS
jgi:sulfur-oxidizing protein SoxY